MALLEVGGRKFTVSVSDVVLGSDAGCTIVLGGVGKPRGAGGAGGAGPVLPRHAILRAQPDGQVIIRKAVPQADVRINGVRLGAEPTPLLHGDKVEIGGHELTFVDERRSGSTQYLQAMKPSPGAGAAPPGTRAGQPTASTGGRIVCLTDGREYVITGTTLAFGRDATCDVVVPGKDVSRRHCEIVQGPRGYGVADTSTNGTFVNEERVQGQRPLARGDILRIGDEQFRFYADPVPVPAGAVLGEPAASAPPGQPPPGAAARLRDTVHGVPPPAPDARSSGGGPLAAFFVKQGDLKGQRLAVRSPVVNVGRADYNDVLIPDVSVSTAHAKLQRREGVWVLVDLDSTNGTFVDGERVKGEAALAPGSLVRLGDVQLVFEPTDDALGVVKGGGTHVMEKVPAPPAPKPPAAPARKGPEARAPGKRPVAQTPEPQTGKGCGSGAAVLLLGTVVALVYWIVA
jgi:pSer/pThr/pTyr-binding forkhead associated (FHA) protein